MYSENGFKFTWNKKLQSRYNTPVLCYPFSLLHSVFHSHLSFYCLNSHESGSSLKRQLCLPGDWTQTHRWEIRIHPEKLIAFTEVSNQVPLPVKSDRFNILGGGEKIDKHKKKKIWEANSSLILLISYFHMYSVSLGLFIQLVFNWTLFIFFVVVVLLPTTEEAPTINSSVDASALNEVSTLEIILQTLRIL